MARIANTCPGADSKLVYLDLSDLASARKAANWAALDLIAEKLLG